MPYATSEGVRIHYRVEGSGPPVVLQHGFTDSLDSWYEFGYVDGLAGDHRVVLIDARGHGESDKPHDPGVYGYRDAVGDVVAVLDDLGIEHAGVVGHSMGGGIALAVAKWAPERSDAVVVGSYPPSTARTDEPPDLSAMLAGGPPGVVATWEQLGPVSAGLRARLVAVDVEAMAAVLANTSEDRPADALRSYPGRYLVVAGQLDWAYADIVAGCEGLRPGALVTLAGLNHLEAFQRSDIVLPHLRRFLAG